MLLGFRPRFVPFVLEGSKTHTIRAERKRQPRAGEVCHCYTGLRTKKARLLGRWRCVKVETIQIYERGDGTFGVIITSRGDYHELGIAEKNALAWQDGFRDSGRRGAFASMMRYWVSTHGDRHGPLDFTGDLIHWNYNETCPAPGSRRRPTAD